MLLDKFKAFLNGEINLPALKKVVDLKNVALQLVHIGDHNSLIKIDRSVGQNYNITLNIDSKAIKDPTLIAKQVGELIQDHVQNENKPVLEITASETVKEISSASKYNESIDFFAGKIPEKDLLTLRAAYFIREESDLNKPVADLVKSISASYGPRGANIVNLCGRGYFEDYLRPMYEMLESNPNFEKRMFLENYELIVTNAPFAYFVHKNQSVEDLVNSLVKKIPFSKRYGQRKLAIHAIGHENIDKVNKAIADTRLSAMIDPDPEVEMKRNVLTMTIHFKS